MSEADLREGLRAAVGDEPPLDFDADDLIRRAQHARKRRRALVAVGVVTLALTGTVLSLPGVLDRRSVVDAASGPVLTTTASPSPSQAPARVTTPPLSTTGQPTTTTTLREGVKTHLTVVLGKKFAEIAPDVKVVSTEAVEATDGPPGHVYAWVSFVDGVGASKVVVRLIPRSAAMTRDEYCAEAGCEGPLRQPDGSYVTSSWRTTTLPDPKGVMHSVAHFRLDGTVVEVRAFGYAPPADGVQPDAVALKYDELASLATDPRLIAP